MVNKRIEEFGMPFISKNELDKLDFSDCVCTEFKREGDTISLSLEGLIIKANNSQNANFTDSYSDVTICKLEGVEVLAVLKEGYTRYDANDNVIEEVLDDPIAPSEYEKLYELLKESYLVRFFRTKEDYLMEFELPCEDGDMPDAYEFRVDASSVTFTWDKYLNRVQN